MEDLNDALLATQGALLEAVTPELRAVIIDLDNKKNLFFIRFYYDGRVDESLIDLWECAITEASAGIDVYYNLDNAVERLDYPQEIPCRGTCAYWRKE